MATGYNIVQCPSPPGGRAVCEADQLAICRVRNGEAETQCVNPPDHLNVLIRLWKPFERPMPDWLLRPFDNWALENITLERRSGLRRLTPDDVAILMRGFHVNHELQLATSFRLAEVHRRSRPAAAGGIVADPIVSMSRADY